MGFGDQMPIHQAVQTRSIHRKPFNLQIHDEWASDL